MEVTRSPSACPMRTAHLFVINLRGSNAALRLSTALILSCFSLGWGTISQGLYNFKNEGHWR